jgi:TolA-binding protein
MPYAAAAVLVLLLSPLVWQWLPQTKDSQLQALLQPAVANVLRDAGEDDPQQQLRKKALSFYNNKQYDQAIAASQQYIKQYGIGDQDIQYFLAASLYLKGEYLKANQLFDLLGQGNSTYAQEAQWMQAAVQYQLENIPACRQILQQILQQPDHVRYRSAKQLLEKIQ